MDVDSLIFLMDFETNANDQSIKDSNKKKPVNPGASDVDVKVIGSEGAANTNDGEQEGEAKQNYDVQGNPQ